MIGVDTNVLARFVLHDDPWASARADAFFAERSEQDPAFISDVTAVELTWVLTKQQRWAKADAYAVLRALLSQNAIVFQHEQEVIRAIHDAEARGADFADALIAQLGVSAGCDYSVTLDRRATALAGMVALD